MEYLTSQEGGRSTSMYDGVPVSTVRYENDANRCGTGRLWCKTGFETIFSTGLKSRVNPRASRTHE